MLFLSTLLTKLVPSNKLFSDANASNNDMGVKFILQCTRGGIYVKKYRK